MSLYCKSPGYHSSVFFYLIITILSTIPTPTYSTSFNFPNFPDEHDLHLEGDSSVANNSLDLTKSFADRYDNVGRATYSKPIQLWSRNSTDGSLRVTDFTTHFSFTIRTINNTFDFGYGDGMTFFLAPFGSKLPPKSGGGSLGLLSGDVAEANLPTRDIIAVEFDTFQNGWDPDSDHVGINVNSIISVTNVSLEVGALKNGTTANAWVTYDSASQNLSVYLTYADKPLSRGNSAILYHIVELSRYLPAQISVGFSASTGTAVEIHRIHSWEFNSTLDADEGKGNTTDEVPKPKTNPTNTTFMNQGRRNGKTKHGGLLVGLVVGLAILGCGLGFAMFIWLKKRGARSRNLDDGTRSSDRDEEFEKETGPKRFSYRELVTATSNFDEEGKLGEGGFGGVYKGFLPGVTPNVAVKKISSGSKQGKKEYLSEIRIISRLRHKNLVQLVGWCHEGNELLLVYEFMPNRSLDNHLFCGETVLSWEVRYKIAVGLASALMYLHEEWEQCVVHRDIKSSNVMLDSNFNAKLGDFGLARFVDHQQSSQSTVLAGTMGYLAPECIFSGKSSKESDVYSFGIVLLEIASGRRPVVPYKRNLVEWVWELHGAGNIAQAADEKLDMSDVQQIQRVMVLGLWCAHPDPAARPSIKQANNLLNYDSPLAKLPSKLPTPVFYTPPMHVCKLAFASACGDTRNSQTDGTVCTCSSCSNTNLSQSTMLSDGSSSSEYLLRSYQG